MELKKNWTVYLVQHSHTDIGYTERQDKIIGYHYHFIKQAIDLLDEIHLRGNREIQGFKWQCENHWQVKNFYKRATPEEIASFEKYVKMGEIGLSGNYLNLTELINYPVLFDKLKEAKQYGESIGHPVRSGMSADINGFSWGYSEALYQNGITRFFSCLHAHHGLFPLYKKQMPFRWETPNGNHILVWNGEQYHLGNALGLAPRAGGSYMIYDELGPDVNRNEMKVVTLRVPRYLKNLEQEGYPYDFIPVMISGTLTDNAPPSAEIVRRMKELNTLFDGKIRFEMTTLDGFFDRVEKDCTDIPTYKGDWNDWWADGVGSTAAVVKNYRDAQRKYNLCLKLDPDGSLSDPALMQSAAENLILYAEHTWGYSSSVSEPWETLVNDLELKKSAYAINANTEVSENLDRVLEAKGEVAIRPDREKLYKAINPHDVPITGTVKLYLEFWEMLDGHLYQTGDPIEVIDVKTGEVLPAQARHIARAREIEVKAHFAPGQERIFRLRSLVKVQHAIKNHAYIGSEGVADILPYGEDTSYRTDTAQIETDYFILSMDMERGIRSIVDKEDGSELVRADAPYAPFVGIYEITDNKPHPCEIRRSMGRNRKSHATRRFSAKVSDIRIVDNGEVFAAAELDFALEGTRMYTVYLKVYKQLPRMDAMVRIHKESRWEPENLYISLPFTTADAGEVKYVDKTGCIIRPGIDQLPGSNREFYLIQNGISCVAEKKSLSIGIKDAPLVVFGDLQAHPIALCTGEDLEYNRGCAYSWVMNNFWETNFKVDLGGFYEFAYSLTLHHGECSPAQAMKTCEVQNEGMLAFYI